MSQPFKNWYPVEGTNEEWWMHECRDGTLILWKKSWGGDPNLVHVHLNKEGAQRFFATYKPVRELYKIYRNNPSEDTKQLLAAFHAKMNVNFSTPTQTEEKTRQKIREMIEKEFEEYLENELKEVRARFIENFKKDADQKGKKGLKAWFEDCLKNNDPEIEKMINDSREKYKNLLLSKKKEIVESRIKETLENYKKSVSES